MVLWDKTRGPQKVQAIASMSECNVFLFSADPKISSIDDYSPLDRIAMTDVKTTTWALLLQMAAAKKYGWEQRHKFEPLSVAMANGEATAAMLSGKTEVKSHMTMLPFSDVERTTGRIKTVLSSRDVLGSRYSAAVAFSTEKFEPAEIQILSAAISDAFDEAMEFITNNPEEAAKIYNKHEPQKGGVEAVIKMMDPKAPDELQFQLGAGGIRGVRRLHVQKRHAEDQGEVLEGLLLRARLVAIRFLRSLCRTSASLSACS